MPRRFFWSAFTGALFLFATGAFGQPLSHTLDSQPRESHTLDHSDGVNPVPILPDKYLWFDLEKPIPPLQKSPVRLERRYEPLEIQNLRRNAQEMVNKIKDFTAIYTQSSRTGKTLEITSRYKIRMVYGRQTFTDQTTGVEINQLPCPKYNGLNSGGEWSDLPAMVGNSMKLKIQQVEDVDLDGWGKAKVFRYEASAEDGVVGFIYCVGTKQRFVTVAARGEVWTDENLQILRMTRELQVPRSSHLQRVSTSVLYGWLQSPNGEPRLVPTNVVLMGVKTTGDNEPYWAVGKFTGYRVFNATVSIGGGSQ